MVQYRIDDFDPELWEELKAATPRSMTIEEKLEELVDEHVA